MTLFNVLSLGGFIPTKDVEVAMEAFASFYHQVTNKHQRRLRITIIDKGDNQRHFEELARTLDIQQVLTIISCNQQEGVEAFYAKSATILLPTRQRLGMIIPEALSFGLPVLSLEEEHTKEHIDNSCGMLIRYQGREQSIEEFSRCLRILYFDPEALKILKKGAFNQYEKNFTWASKRSVRIGA